MVRQYRNFSKTFKTPRRPFEKERLDRELKLCGEFGLRCKREIWRVQLVLAKMRSSARNLLTLPETDPKRLIEGSPSDPSFLQLFRSRTAPSLLEVRAA